jgi:5-methylcytosine-specific restriction endonuclease McrA
MNYHKYIAGRRWRQNPTRLAELEAAGFRCRPCSDHGEDVALEVHHRTYANLGREQPGDLTALCRRCPIVVTDHLRRLRYSRRAPAHADIRCALEDPPPLFDPTFKETI